MLRNIVRKTLLEENYRSKLSKVIYLCIIVGSAWLFSGPFYAEEVFTSENALRGSYLDSEF